MSRLLALALGILVVTAASAIAAPTGSIFFSSDGGAGGSNVQLILNGGGPINSADSGWYTDAGLHNPNNTNYINGLCSNCGGAIFRDFFVFNIPVGLTVTSATLFLDTFIYDSLSASETLTLFDVSTNLNSLLGGTGGIAAYNDLGSGVSYGSRVYTLADQNLFRSITLNAAALAAIQASAGGLFALGGALESQAVPEPSTLSLLGVSLAALIARRRTRGISK